MLTLKERITVMVIVLIVALITCFSIQAQTVKSNGSGIFTEVKTAKDTTPDKPTGDIFIDSKGIKYPVYKGKKGSFYCLHTSKKTNKVYRHYLTVSK